MELTYTLIPGGYVVRSTDGRIHINQPFAPGEPGFRSMPPAEAEAAAKALIAELEASESSD